jgi:hypothetical protein
MQVTPVRSGSPLTLRPLHGRCMVLSPSVGDEKPTLHVCAAAGEGIGIVHARSLCMQCRGTLR